MDQASRSGPCEGVWRVTMHSLNEYMELWTDCLKWIEEPDAGERISSVLVHIDELDGPAGLYLFCVAAVLCGTPDELIGREDVQYQLQVAEPDWHGFENLLLAAGQFMLAVVRQDFDTAQALFRAQFGERCKPIDRTAAFISLVLHVAKEEPYLSVDIRLL